jgi:hypothetical protein
MKRVFPFLLLIGGCATMPPPNTTAQDATIARGPWSEVPAVEMPTGDTSIPIALLRDVADALLKRAGAKVCDPLTQRPISGLSTEYCSTVYVAGDRESLSWRVSEPVGGKHGAGAPSSGCEMMTTRPHRSGSLGTSIPPVARPLRRTTWVHSPPMHSIRMWPWQRSA